MYKIQFLQKGLSRPGSIHEWLGQLKSASFSQYQKVQKYQFFAGLWLERISKTILYFNLLNLETYSAPFFEGVDADAELSPPNKDVLVELVGFEETVLKERPGLETQSPKPEDEGAMVGSLAAEVVAENKPEPPNFPGPDVVVEEAKRPRPVAPVAIDGVEVDESVGLGATKLKAGEGLLDEAPSCVGLADRCPNKLLPPPEPLLRDGEEPNKPPLVGLLTVGSPPNDKPVEAGL